MFKRWLSAGLILLAVCLGGSVITARADNDDKQALATVPQGILINKTNPFLTTDTTNKSSATIVNGENPASPGTQVAVLTNGKNQFGSIWSTNSGYWNLKKNQRLSAWLYLGNRGKLAGEGMAFVLQNDSRNLAAMPQSSVKKKSLPGETLGVWGVDNNKAQSTKNGIAATAIQNSWALEFDTQYNGVTGSKAPGNANSFDVGMAGVHIASNYPAQASSYEQLVTDYGFWGGLFSKKDYHYQLIHQGLITDTNHPDFLSNGSWHHLTLKWDAKAENMTYIFDDKNPVTEAKLPGKSQTVHIDTKKIDPQRSNRARWGFTATTTDRYENNMVVFENIPGLIVINTSGEITDVKRQRKLTTDSQVLSNDKLQVDYHLDYEDGQQPWSDIQTHIDLPTGITYESAEVTYSHGATQKIPLDSIRDGKLAIRLAESLSQSNAHATIKLLGRADTVKETQVVPAASGSFTSSARISSADTPQFIINPNAHLELTVTSNHATSLSKGEGTTVKGRVDVVSNTATSPKVTVRPVLNGKQLNTVTVEKDGTFKIPLAGNQLQAGTNRLRLVAKSFLGDTSQTVIVPITVAGELKFAAVSPNETFEASKLTGKTQFVKRRGDWQLAISDTRGTGEQWTLVAQASQFTTSDGTAMSGQPVYVDDFRVISLGETPTPVLTHTTDDAVDDGTFDVAKTWTPDTGVLLELNGGAAAGDYQGTITWTLLDAPN